MHLDSGLQLHVMSVTDVGVAPADMSDDDAILAFQLVKQCMRGMGVGAFSDMSAKSAICACDDR